MIDLFNFIIESCISYLFISTIPDAEHSLMKNRKLNYILSFGVLACSLPLFLFTYSLNQPIRITIWFCIFSLAIKFSKQQEWLISFYQSAILTIIHTAYGCIWMSPLFRAARLNFYEKSFSLGMKFLALCILPESIYFLFVFLSTKFIKFEYLQKISINNAIGIALAFFSQAYLRSTLHNIYLVSDSNGYLTISIYSFCFTLFVIGFVFLLESNRVKDLKIQMQTQTEAANYYRLENYRINEKYNERLHSVYHDFKNHLLALDHMSKSGMNTELNEYIQTLITDLHPTERRYNTGHELLNGLIATKDSIAKSLDISFVSNIFLEKDFPLSDVDIFTVFGNLLDNAIEAVDKVPIDSPRYIRLSSYKKENFYIISISNTFNGVLIKKNGHLYTTKKNEQLHGIGLKNIHNVIKKYNGNIFYNTSSKTEFSISIFVPFSLEDDNEL